MAQTVILRGEPQKALAHQFIEQVPNGTVLKFQKPGRSLDQNAKMWAVLSDISRARPQGRTHTPEVWKSLFMAACGHETRFVEGLNGEPFPVGFRTSQLTKAQMAELIEFIQAWAIQNGVLLND